MRRAKWWIGLLAVFLAVELYGVFSPAKQDTFTEWWRGTIMGSWVGWLFTAVLIGWLFWHFIIETWRRRRR